MQNIVMSHNSEEVTNGEQAMTPHLKSLFRSFEVPIMPSFSHLCGLHVCEWTRFSLQSFSLIHRIYVFNTVHINKIH